MAAGHSVSKKDWKLSGLQNPFSDPVNQDSIQLQDVPGLVSQQETANFVSEHPSRYPKHATQQTSPDQSRMPVVQEVEDNPASEWETVAGEDELKPLKMPNQFVPRRYRSIELILQSQSVVKPPQRSGPLTHRRNTALLPQTTSRNLANSAQRVSTLLKDDSTWSASSVYADEDKERATWFYDENENFNSTCRKNNNFDIGWRRPAAMENARHVLGELAASGSKASSNASADPFRYDDVSYSPFLRPSAEKDVSRALYNAATTSDSDSAVRGYRQKYHSEAATTRTFHPGSFYDPIAIQST